MQQVLKKVVPGLPNMYTMLLPHSARNYDTGTKHLLADHGETNKLEVLPYINPEFRDILNQWENMGSQNGTCLRNQSESDIFVSASVFLEWARENVGSPET